MASNHNQMPVMFADDNCSWDVINADGPDPIHSCYNKGTKLKALTDWIYIRSLDGYFSPGDILLLIGMYLFRPFLFGLVILILDDYKFFG